MAPQRLECPVFYPTLEQVQGTDFESYVRSVERKFKDVGACRIVMPQGWKPRRAGYSRLQLTLPRPIRQHATGRAGLFRTLLVEQKEMSLDEFAAMAAVPENAPPPGVDAEALERKYWKNVTLNPPLYAADVPGTLFDKSVKGWNLSALSSLLSRTLDQHGINMPGVNSPYLYVGAWRSTFAWHTEDMDLHSTNYLHCGAPKTWYIIPPAYRKRFELLMQSLLPELFRVCPEFLRHKELLASPGMLAGHNIPVVKMQHNPREFVVVYPGVYHSGFNHGFNIAESVNFATQAWLEIGADAGFCECHEDTAKIDMRLFLPHMRPALRREVLAMYESDSSDDEEEEEEEEESGSETSSQPDGSVCGGESTDVDSAGTSTGAAGSSSSEEEEESEEESEDQEGSEASGTAGAAAAVAAACCSSRSHAGGSGSGSGGEEASVGRSGRAPRAAARGVAIATAAAAGRSLSRPAKRQRLTAAGGTAAQPGLPTPQPRSRQQTGKQLRQQQVRRQSAAAGLYSGSALAPMPAPAAAVGKGVRSSPRKATPRAQRAAQRAIAQLSTQAAAAAAAAARREPAAQQHQAREPAAAIAAAAVPAPAQQQQQQQQAEAVAAAAQHTQEEAPPQQQQEQQAPAAAMPAEHAQVKPEVELEQASQPAAKPAPRPRQVAVRPAGAQQQPAVQRPGTRSSCRLPEQAVKGMATAALLPMLRSKRKATTPARI